MLNTLYLSDRAWSEVTSKYAGGGGVGTACFDKQILCLTTYVMGALRMPPLTLKIFCLGMNHSVSEEFDGCVWLYEDMDDMLFAGKSVAISPTKLVGD